MRFMLFIHPGLPPSTEENLIPSREAIEAMSRYNRQLHEAGVLLDVNGLHSPNEAARISFPGGKPLRGRVRLGGRCRPLRAARLARPRADGRRALQQRGACRAGHALAARGLRERAPVLFLSGQGDIPLVVAAMSKGSLDFVAELKQFGNR